LGRGGFPFGLQQRNKVKVDDILTFDEANGKDHFGGTGENY